MDAAAGAPADLALLHRRADVLVSRLAACQQDQQEGVAGELMSASSSTLVALLNALDSVSQELAAAQASSTTAALMKPSAWATRENKYKQDLMQLRRKLAAQDMQLAQMQADLQAASDGTLVSQLREEIKGLEAQVAEHRSARSELCTRLSELTARNQALVSSSAAASHAWREIVMGKRGLHSSSTGSAHSASGAAPELPAVLLAGSDSPTFHHAAAADAHQLHHHHAFSSAGSTGSAQLPPNVTISVEHLSVSAAKAKIEQQQALAGGGAPPAPVFPPASAAAAIALSTHASISSGAATVAAAAMASAASSLTQQQQLQLGAVVAAAGAVLVDAAASEGRGLGDMRTPLATGASDADAPSGAAATAAGAPLLDDDSKLMDIDDLLGFGSGGAVAEPPAPPAVGSPAAAGLPAPGQPQAQVGGGELPRALPNDFGAGFPTLAVERRVAAGLLGLGAVEEGGAVLLSPGGRPMRMAACGTGAALLTTAEAQCQTPAGPAPPQTAAMETQTLEVAPAPPRTAAAETQTSTAHAGMAEVARGGQGSVHSMLVAEASTQWHEDRGPGAGAALLAVASVGLQVELLPVGEDFAAQASPICHDMAIQATPLVNPTADAASQACQPTHLADASVQAASAPQVGLDMGMQADRPVCADAGTSTADATAVMASDVGSQAMAAQAPALATSGTSTTDLPASSGVPPLQAAGGKQSQAAVDAAAAEEEELAEALRQLALALADRDVAAVQVAELQAATGAARAAAQEATGKLAGERDAVLAQVAELQGHVAELQGRVAELEAELVEERARQEAQVAAAAAPERRAELEAAALQAQQARNALEERVRELEAQVAGQSGEVDEAQANAVRTAKSLVQAQEELAGAKEALTRAKAQVAELQAREEKLQLELQAYEHTMEHLKSQVEEGDLALQLQQAQNLELADRLAHLTEFVSWQAQAPQHSKVTHGQWLKRRQQGQVPPAASARGASGNNLGDGSGQLGDSGASAGGTGPGSVGSTSLTRTSGPS